MKRSNRILLIASVFALSVVSADAGFFKHAKADKTSSAAPTVAMTLTGVDVNSGQVLLRTTGTPAYTSYSPAPDLFVVDLTGTSKVAGLILPSTLPAGVASIAADDVVEMGNHLTRISFRLSGPAAPKASVEGSVVSVSVAAGQVAESQAPAGAGAPAIEAKASDVPAATAVIVAEIPHAEPIAEAAQQKLSEPATTSEPLLLQKARKLTGIESAGSGDASQITLAADGEIAYKSFRLDKPERVVLDLTGVRNVTSKSSISIDHSVVKRVRVSQFKGSPDPVTRVVLDLDGKTPYHVVRDGDRLRVVFGESGSVAARAPAPTVAANAPMRATAVPARSEMTVRPSTGKQATSSSDLVEQIPAVAENVAPPASWKMPESASAGARPTINAARDQAPPPSVPALRGRGSTAPRPENVFDSAAPQASTNISTIRGGATPPGGQSLTGTLNSGTGGRTLGAGERVPYNGEPISLNLKDADIKDVLRTFAQLTGLNVAVDPQVAGTVTVDFVDVPWDQALDIILRQNDLTYDLDGNVMRVGRIDRIANEKAASRRLLEEDRLNVPLSTYRFKLSYARAADVQTLLNEIKSPRARIIVDTRTNQLIISEIPQYLQTMSNLIDSIDVPTRQVVIEARIVETSKTFSQAYGVEWGFQGALDPALGTGTGLVFPNRVNFVGGPFSFSGGAPTILKTTLVDVLGTFNLDLRLNAAESEGLVRVIGAPKVTTQDNTPAEIQSGVSIPYQTRVNFTTTIQYIDATLRLSVTPQITEAGTVIMDISVNKTTPGQPIEGSAGTPLNTRTAKTRLMVRDGGTAVIGGIYQVQEATSQNRIPILHQIPILGNLFKSHNLTTSHDELLIFITPRIVRNS